MLRKTTPASSMQKTYDECYLICSTAIYFEGQNNEAEALRAWRNALDTIYYNNAYKIPSSWQPRTETEKALQDSMRSMELQCKERVDLLEALRKSRREAEEEAAKKTAEDGSRSKESLQASSPPPIPQAGGSSNWMGGNTIPPADYADIPRPTPPPRQAPPPPPRPTPPPRPSYIRKPSGDEAARTQSMTNAALPSLQPPTSKSPRARTPSPEKKQGGMLKTLRTHPKERKDGGKMSMTMRSKPPTAASKAATQVWAGQPRAGSATENRTTSGGKKPNVTGWDPYTRTLITTPTEPEQRRASDTTFIRPPSPSDYINAGSGRAQSDSENRYRPHPYPNYPSTRPYAAAGFSRSEESVETVRQAPPVPPPHTYQRTDSHESVKTPPISEMPPSQISYMKEYPNHPPKPKNPPPIPAKPQHSTSDSDGVPGSSNARSAARASPRIQRKAVGDSRAIGVLNAMAERQKLDNARMQLRERKKSDPQPPPSDLSPGPATRKAPRRKPGEPRPLKDRAVTPPSTDEAESPTSDHPSTPTEQEEWDKKVAHLLKNLPRGVDEQAAKQVLNDIVLQGDEVHWDDVAGLEIAKDALKETVVYPFLRPDLFLGLREPARGMLLFGPPGTGKTMLARAVATESKSVYFAISASSLTSKFLGESEKLVRALFALAKALAPSIIFVDEIDSLLGARGGGSEHEATRRIKTEFLIQWSDLQKAAAGREEKEGSGDATRVLVLAATNLPWAIDDAARRRFVRRQYIPLPESWVREQQFRRLLSHQKHSLSDAEIAKLVELTEGFSGSDITALAKDAAMGPLRSLGERLLHMRPEEIRGIEMRDFEAGLVNIRPSVSKKGLEEFEEWAREFGERGG